MTTPNGNGQAAPQAQGPRERFEQLTERLAPGLEQVATRLDDTNQAVQRFIRQNPGTCLLGAAALGYFIGRLASRR